MNSVLSWFCLFLWFCARLHSVESEEKITEIASTYAPADQQTSSPITRTGSDKTGAKHEVNEEKVQLIKQWLGLATTPRPPNTGFLQTTTAAAYETKETGLARDPQVEKLLESLVGYVESDEEYSELEAVVDKFLKEGPRKDEQDRQQKKGSAVALSVAGDLVPLPVVENSESGTEQGSSSSGDDERNQKHLLRSPVSRPHEKPDWANILKLPFEGALHILNSMKGFISGVPAPMNFDVPGRGPEGVNNPVGFHMYAIKASIGSDGRNLDHKSKKPSIIVIEPVYSHELQNEKDPVKEHLAKALGDAGKLDGLRAAPGGASDSLAIQKMSEEDMSALTQEQPMFGAVIGAVGGLLGAFTLLRGDDVYSGGGYPSFFDRL